MRKVPIDRNKQERRIQLRGGFSDRNGINKINTTMQYKDFDERTRNALLTCVFNWTSKLPYLNGVSRFDYGERIEQRFYRKIISEVFAEAVTVQEGSLDISSCFDDYIRPFILGSNYDEVLTLIEYITNFFEKTDKSHTYFKYTKNINDIFEREFVGYRFIGDKITPITDEIEIKEVNDSLDIKFSGCRAHVNKALTFLSDRNNPDYCNSVKESISAVESICKIIVGKDKATLNNALKHLKDKGINLHPALENSFISLYGYTSDENGVRHGNGLFESNVTFEEAKYMLVSCCAFVNYLIAEYGKIK